ncbi:hypothetical protein DXG03_003396, partial [Asterophora parasitica]
MSSTKTPMLSSMHAIFCGLQSHLRSILGSLPDRTPSKLKQGLVESHRKLSDYYTKFDESPYYIWAALLDPHISYAALKADFKDDTDLDITLQYLSISTASLIISTYRFRFPVGVSPAPAAPGLVSWALLYIKPTFLRGGGSKQHTDSLRELHNSDALK